MAYRNRTPYTPSGGREITEDASQYSRREYEGRRRYDNEEEPGYEDCSTHRDVSQYSRYNASAYGSRSQEGAHGYDPVAGLRRDRVYDDAPDDFYTDDYPDQYPEGHDDEGFADYSRDAYAATASHYASKRSRGKKLKVVLLALILLLLAGAGTAFAYVHSINSNLSSGLDSNLDETLVRTSLTNEPFYMLLLGTDASLERQNDEEYGEIFRTDTILLARIDPIEKKVTLVSMPRDTMIDMGADGTQKLNAAYPIGGASGAVREVSELAGVGISHFCLVDMDGLVSVVDSLGGIEVEVPMEIDDEDAGGHLDAGLQTLNGEQALILCRARNAFADYGAGDIYRAANQRLVLQAIASKVLSSDIATIAKTTTAMSEFIKTDLNVSDIVGLAQAFQGIDAQNSIYTASMPTTSALVDELWYEIVDETAWQAMMARVDQGLPPTETSQVDGDSGVILSNSGSVDEAKETAADQAAHSGTVSVRNGTDVDGAGSGTSAVLSGDGYSVVDVAGADATDYATTLVVYSDSSKAVQAEAIATLLGSSAKAELNDGSYITSSDYLVIVGSDLATSLAAHAPATDSATGSASAGSATTSGQGAVYTEATTTQ